MGSVAVLYVTMLLFSLSVSSIGLMVSSFASTQQQAFLGCFTVGVPCILLSGFMTPVNNMPMFLQDLSQLNPLAAFYRDPSGAVPQGYHHECGTGQQRADRRDHGGIHAVRDLDVYAQGIGPDTLRIDSGMAIKEKSMSRKALPGPAKGVREARRR